MFATGFPQRVATVAIICFYYTADPEVFRMNYVSSTIILGRYLGR